MRLYLSYINNFIFNLFLKKVMYWRVKEHKNQYTDLKYQ